VRTRAATLCLTVVFGVSAGERPGDWTGPYEACDGHAELSKPGHMSLGVRFATSKVRVAAAFAQAMSFWADVLDMEWHTENGRECAIQVVDGHDWLFASAQSARAQFPTARSFQGWIAFNPRMTLPANELFTTAVHEIGHTSWGCRTVRIHLRSYIFCNSWTGLPRQSRCFRLGGASQTAARGILVSGTLGRWIPILPSQGCSAENLACAHTQSAQRWSA
jgi:hypothetical protein